MLSTSPITHEAAHIIAEMLGREGVLVAVSRVSDTESVVSVKEG